MLYRLFRNCLALLALWMSASVSQGDVTVNWEQSGSDVRVSYSGVIPLTEIYTRNTTEYTDFSFNPLYFAAYLEGQDIAFSAGSGIDLPLSQASTIFGGGDTFGFSETYVYWEEAASEAISGWMLFESMTLAALNADNFDNLKVFESNEGTFDVYFHTIPEPSSVVMIGAGLLGAACWLRRRKVA